MVPIDNVAAAPMPVAEKPVTVSPVLPAVEPEAAGNATQTSKKGTRGEDPQGNA